MTSSRFKLALIQLAVGKNKLDNVANACMKIAEASKAGAKIISLPECFNSPYGNTYFPEYAEPIPGETSSALSKAAKDNEVYLVGGSIPENDAGKLYNTCTIYNPEGELIAKYRKSHLFDIDIPGKITFQESKTLTKGNKLVTFDTPYCRVGIGICFDIRFPQMAKAYANAGCHVLLYPGAFNMTTGPAHWELLTRARAVDNLSYIGCCSPARDDTASYKAWGHSLVVSPWGDVITQADEKEQIVYADIDLDKVKEIRGQIPVFDTTQPELYSSSIENVPC